MTQNQASGFDISRILQLLPHRYPFLLVDKAEAFVPATSIVGIKNVTHNEPFFPGHFPHNPVMPGVLIIEAMAQTSAVLVVETLALHDSNRLVYFMGIDSAKFRSPVQPGDQLELHVTVLRGGSKVWRFRGEAFVGDKVVAQADFAAMIMSPEDAAAKG